MEVTVRLFASLREHAGTSSLSLDLADGSTVADALSRLVGDVLPTGSDQSLVAAINREYVKPTAALHQGDELALLPPVSGGADDIVRAARITAEPLDPYRLEALVRDPRAGATITFCGTTRDVPALEYEAYVEMAAQKLHQIAAEVVAEHGLICAAVEHRTGRVPLSEPSVVCAVSAGHRGECFAGARALIDRVKAEAPIWKQEEDESGDRTWVEGTLPPV